MRALATTLNLRRWIRDCRQRAELISSLVESDRSFSLKYIHLDILLCIHREMRIMATYTHTHTHTRNQWTWWWKSRKMLRRHSWKICDGDARFPKFGLYKSSRNRLSNAIFYAIFITFDNLIRRICFVFSLVCCFFLSKIVLHWSLWMSD